eukprot:CAMPEP_0197675346 /NCGR_PEP_ID=MMETSP1338-20131121/84775_1 /TAXON_ID=43686 ORGANISM="Pelagodinium beii, Strain RCC1491" /NCGR_SAMPLE_ID=MMETSP1338 /ASSEMBLY_ACC=CAM_ASM_000754 /LENGTH=219 /DNA_ID=CAMNT_0043255881 /DNA_START=128 /DNA_END=787 /DNA_ORIENTATION=+
MRGNEGPAWAQIESIVAQSVKNNLQVGISGHMCYDAKLRSVWQVLEGTPEAVERLWSRISADSRHAIDEDTLKVEEVESRNYPVGWGMRCLTLEPGSRTAKDECEKSDLMQLLYKSVINDEAGQGKEVMEGLVPKFMVNNARIGITGWMLYNDRSLVVYQVLEGPPEAVERLWEKIRNDKRHRVMPESVRRRPMKKREFENWSMAMDAVERTAWMDQTY